MTQGKWKRVIWAVDALAEDKDLQSKVVHVARALAENLGAQIQPVYVMGPQELGLSSEFFLPNQRELSEQIEFRLAHWISSFELPNCTAPKIIPSSSLQLRDAVDKLLDYARGQSADLILVSTMARKGASRFLFGSFAETLVLKADVPTLIVSPQCQFTGRVEEILFPSDLSDNFRFALPYVGKLAKEWGAKVSLFHHLERFTPLFPDVASTLPAYDQYMRDQEGQRQAALSGAEGELKALGVRAEIKLDSSPNFVAEAIVSAANKMRSGIVTVVSESGPVAASLLGSVSRRVIRDSKCLVWVIHHKRTGQQA